MASHARRHDGPLEAVGRELPALIPVPDWSKPIILALVLTAAAFGMRARCASRRTRRMESQRTDLLRDVNAMQGALVPEIPARVGDLAVSVAYRPADGPAAGGDFYDVFELGAGRVAIILGDVAGHGHEALRQAALTRYTVRAYVLAGLAPRVALAVAGSVLESRGAEHFATVAVAVYDRRGSELTYALAGHPPPVLRCAGVPEPLTICASPPVGIGAATGRRQSAVALPPGSQVCFFTDGLVEARAHGTLLGREGLTELLEELGSRGDAHTLLQRIRAKADASSDDMAACIIAPTTTASVAPARIEELEADARELEGEQVQRFLRACGIDRSESVRARRLAVDIASTCATAVLRVEIGAAGAVVNALEPTRMREIDQPPDRAPGAVSVPG